MKFEFRPGQARGLLGVLLATVPRLDHRKDCQAHINVCFNIIKWGRDQPKRWRFRALDNIGPDNARQDQNSPDHDIIATGQAWSQKPSIIILTDCYKKLHQFFLLFPFLFFFSGFKFPFFFVKYWKASWISLRNTYLINWKRIWGRGLALPLNFCLFQAIVAL